MTDEKDNELSLAFGIGGLAAETERLVSQSHLGRMLARGHAQAPLFPEKGSGTGLADRTALLLAGSWMVRRRGNIPDAA